MIDPITDLDGRFCADRFDEPVTLGPDGSVAPSTSACALLPPDFTPAFVGGQISQDAAHLELSWENNTHLRWRASLSKIAPENVDLLMLRTGSFSGLITFFSRTVDARSYSLQMEMQLFSLLRRCLKS
jgi:hypothetical protein